MIMKHLNYLPLVLLVGLLAASCSDKFLDAVPKGQLSGSTFWKTQNDVNLALAGCYRKRSAIRCLQVEVYRVDHILNSARRYWRAGVASKDTRSCTWSIRA